MTDFDVQSFPYTFHRPFSSLAPPEFQTLFLPLLVVCDYSCTTPFVQTKFPLLLTKVSSLFLPLPAPSFVLPKGISVSFPSFFWCGLFLVPPLSPLPMVGCFKFSFFFHLLFFFPPVLPFLFLSASSPGGPGISC